MVLIKIIVKKHFTGIHTTSFNIFEFLGISFSLKDMESPRITVDYWIGANSRNNFFDPNLSFFIFILFLIIKR